jgi:death on curing protein
MSETLKHPTVEVVVAIHEQVLTAHGGSAGLRSRELLESAVAAPQATMLGQPMIFDPIEIAAAYLYYL